MLQNRIACFQKFHFSFVRFDVSYCGVPVSEVELMIRY
jgi:hypothetical protein